MSRYLCQKVEDCQRESEKLFDCLHPDEYYFQAVTEVSPPLWNIAHTAWFFAVVLQKLGISIHEEKWNLFNSYYNAVGERIGQGERGEVLRYQVSRDDVLFFRKTVYEKLIEIISTKDLGQKVQERIELGINHEQQHQELMIYEVLRNRYQHHEKMFPDIFTKTPSQSKAVDLQWIEFHGGVEKVGYAGKGFSYDNERGVHSVYINPVRMMSRPVTNAEFLEFVSDGGYQNYRWWSDDVWIEGQVVLKLPGRNESISTPQYWHKDAKNSYICYGINGWQELDMNAPVAYISWYEAQAYARWLAENQQRQVRLPTEFEWEVAANQIADLDNANLMTTSQRPVFLGDTSNAMIGTVWEWTNSAYLSYPGFKPFEGVVEEYNGKFMGPGKMVLRGGSWATPSSHIRISYRNFWPGCFRFASPGMRLVEDVQ